jgi:hypothetical protein
MGTMRGSMVRTMLVATTALVGVLAGPTVRAGAAGTLKFTQIDAPTTDEAKREVRASPEITLDGKATKIGFVPLLRSGDKLGSGTFGLILDEKGVPIVGEDGAPMISNATDFSSLLEKDGHLYVVSHFETRPAAVYVTKVDPDPDPATGELKATDTEPVDFSAFGGLWVPCAGSITPWGTHLGSEEYEPDARVIETTADLNEVDDYPKPMALYFGYDAMSKAAKPTMAGFREVFKPFRYGYITEVSVDDEGKATGVKH